MTRHLGQMLLPHQGHSYNVPAVRLPISFSLSQNSHEVAGRQRRADQVVRAITAAARTGTSSTANNFRQRVVLIALCGSAPSYTYSKPLLSFSVSTNPVHARPDHSAAARSVGNFCLGRFDLLPKTLFMNVWRL